MADACSSSDMAASDSSIARAAAAISAADALLIITGAGMGVDSGLATFRGRNAGVWPQLLALGLDSSDLSMPVWFRNDPRLAWAFWHDRYQAYLAGTPHAGYDLLAKWGSKAGCRHGCFSVTSNIDGHWARTPGLPEDRLCECHGSVDNLQRVTAAKARERAECNPPSIWSAVPETLASMAMPVWDLAPGENVEVLTWESSVDEDSWIDAVFSPDGSGSVFASPSILRAQVKPLVGNEGGKGVRRLVPGARGGGGGKVSRGDMFTRAAAATLVREQSTLLSAAASTNLFGSLVESSDSDGGEEEDTKVVTPHRGEMHGAGAGSSV